MKYNENNKPLVCMMTQSTCYKGTRKFTPKGVLWHSTGANNPWLKRYVQPDDNAADRMALLNKLGKNSYGNDWNHITQQAGLNFWIGKLADGTVAAVQTMPWDYRPWGCGSGSKGSCNNTHIQFEICEDGLNDKSYWDAVYKEALEMTAYLCRMFNIDPKGTISVNGVTCPTIIDHTGSNSLGLGSNHGDIQHWSKKYGVTMAIVRNDVAAILAEGNTQTTTQSAPATDGTADEAKTIWDTLYAEIKNAYGAAGLMGNLYAESALHANNLQNNGNTKLGMTDEQFTAAYDSGAYAMDTFIHDGYGYGLAQWTYYSRKEALAKFAKEKGTSIGDLSMQLAFLLKEITGYTSVWKTLTTATTVRAASDAVLLNYERPADQSEAVQKKRAAYGQTYYEKYATASAPATTKYYRVRKSWKDASSQIGAFTILQNSKNCVDANPGYAVFDDSGNQVYPAVQTTATPFRVKVSVSDLRIRKGAGTDTEWTGKYTGIGVFTIVEVVSGSGSNSGWGKLKSGAGYIALDHCQRL